MTELLFEPSLFQYLWEWVGRSKSKLAIFTLGGFVLEAIVMVYFLLPLATKHNYRYFIAVAFSIPILTITLVFVFGFIDNDYWAVGSDEYLLMSIPYFISLVIYIYGASKLLKNEISRNRKITNIFASVVGLFGWLWSFYISEAFMHNCIMASCV